MNDRKTHRPDGKIGEDGGIEVLDSDIAALFSTPLLAIDFDADLDRVLVSDSIGDAMQVLCPSLRGS